MVFFNREGDAQLPRLPISKQQETEPLVPGEKSWSDTTQPMPRRGIFSRILDAIKRRSDATNHPVGEDVLGKDSQPGQGAVRRRDPHTPQE